MPGRELSAAPNWYASAGFSAKSALIRDKRRSATGSAWYVVGQVLFSRGRPNDLKPPAPANPVGMPRPDRSFGGQLRNPVTVYNATARVERQSLYNPAAPGTDPWYAEDVMALFSPGAATYSLTLDNPVPTAGTARLGVDLWGITDWPGKDPDHHVIVSLNGTSWRRATPVSCSRPSR